MLIQPYSRLTYGGYRQRFYGFCCPCCRFPQCLFCFLPHQIPIQFVTSVLCHTIIFPSGKYNPAALFIEQRALYSAGPDIQPSEHHAPTPFARFLSTFKFTGKYIRYSAGESSLLPTPSLLFSQSLLSHDSKEAFPHLLLP